MFRMFDKNGKNFVQKLAERRELQQAEEESEISSFEAKKIRKKYIQSFYDALMACFNETVSYKGYCEVGTFVNELNSYFYKNWHFNVATKTFYDDEINDMNRLRFQLGRRKMGKSNGKDAYDLQQSFVKTMKDDFQFVVKRKLLPKLSVLEKKLIIFTYIASNLQDEDTIRQINAMDAKILKAKLLDCILLHKPSGFEFEPHVPSLTSKVVTNVNAAPSKPEASTLTAPVTSASTATPALVPKNATPIVSPLPTKLQTNIVRKTLNLFDTVFPTTVQGDKLYFHFFYTTVLSLQEFRKFYRYETLEKSILAELRQYLQEKYLFSASKSIKQESVENHEQGIDQTVKAILTLQLEKLDIYQLRQLYLLQHYGLCFAILFIYKVTKIKKNHFTIGVKVYTSL